MMSTSKIAYLIVNIIVLLVAASILYYDCQQGTYSFGFQEITIIAITSVLVNVIKSFRLFFILPDDVLTPRLYIKQYCKTTLVSILIPFKLGDFFRIYCYGYHLKNYYKSSIYIILDRFFDTLALLSIVLVLLATTHEDFDLVVTLLSLFLVLIIATYVLLPHICNNLKHHFLKTRASAKSLNYLLIISKIEKVYNLVSNAVKGKGAILCALSVMAWLLELGAVSILYGPSGSKYVDYLMAAFGIGNTANNELFVLVTSCLLLLVYAFSRVIIKKSGR